MESEIEARTVLHSPFDLLDWLLDGFGPKHRLLELLFVQKYHVQLLLLVLGLDDQFFSRRFLPEAPRLFARPRWK